MVQDRFSKYVGLLKVEMDGEEPLELDVRLKDKHKIMTLMKDFSEKQGDEEMEALFNVFLDIMKRSYPEDNEEGIKGFLTQKFEQFMSGLSISFGWTTKAALEKKVKELESKNDLKNPQPQ
jgi:uncharacterized protein YbcI